LPKIYCWNGVSGIRGKNLFRLWVADIRALQSHEKDTGNAHVPQIK